MEGLQPQPPTFGCGNDRGVLKNTLLVPPKDESIIDDLFDVNEGSVFHGNFHFPEFPCMSSSSSSSSTPAPAKPYGLLPTSSSASLVAATASPSSVTSWAMLNNDAVAVEEMEKQVQVGDGTALGQPEALASTASMEIILEKPSEEDTAAAAGSTATASSTAVAMSAVDECMDVIENFRYMELLEVDDMFDPTLVFQSDNLLDQEVQHMECFGRGHEEQEYRNELIRQNHDNENEAEIVTDMRCNGVGGVEVGEDMDAVFLEWLQANRNSVSVEDLRKVKIKKSTIETAARRLGGGKEAMKQLLKLILDWVQTNHLPRKYAVESSLAYPDFDQQFIQSNHHPNFTPTQPALAVFADPNTSDSCVASQWAPPPPLFPHPGLDPSSAAIGTYMGSDQMDFPMVDSAQSWAPAVQWPQYEYMENFQPALGSPQGSGGSGFGYPGQYQQQYFVSGSSSDKTFARLGSSATKEARKKRRARQRRLLSLHHHHHHRVCSHRQDASQRNATVEQQTHGMIRRENYCTETTTQLHGNANWMYWSPAVRGGMTAGEQLQVQPQEVQAMHPPPPPQSFPRPMPAQQPDSRQTESNLKFFLQKVLKQSDVGNLGRIVLPKTHLPELEARDGISIAMEDIGTSRVWNMRYRFWPNNKSRMYLLENTGDFVRTNRLEEGDFIVIYSDMKCGKYLIRGVKVPQPEGTAKAATKRPEKSQIWSGNNSNAEVATVLHGVEK